MQITEIQKAAKRHVHGWEFIEVSSVAWTNAFPAGALWYPPHDGKPARIEMGFEQDSDVLWHEFFHSVFHACPLRRSNEDNAWWGEAFCNAFSEVTRDVYFKSFVDDSDFEKAKTDLHWRRYIIPCVLILRHVEFHEGKFAMFWKTINRAAEISPSFFLSSMLGYSPDTGIRQ